MQKIKKNYPYKKTTAIVLRIMRKTYKNNSLSNNDRVDELLLHKEQVGFLEQSNLIDDIDEFRRLYDWYNYVLLVEFIDYKGEKHQGTLEIISESTVNVGSNVDICYLIDNPNEITTTYCNNITVEDYINKKNTYIIILSLFLMFLIIAIVCFRIAG